VWNLAIALGGAVGGVGLAVAGAGALPLLSLPLAIVSLVIVVGGRRYAFPAGRGTASPA
ncbi:MFS transporter, partial [Sanguibacter inulinus]|nr:MFS transporter [Sanguibacter inulinus]NYS95579.1 MFS transporter [Sanguibacter inulinus]